MPAKSTRKKVSGRKKAVKKAARPTRKTVRKVAGPARPAKKTARKVAKPAAAGSPKRGGKKAAAKKPAAKPVPPPRPLIVRKKPVKLTREMLHFRDLLLQEQRELTQAYNISKGNSRSRLDDGTEDYIDYAVSSYAREFLLSLSELDRKQLRHVEDALKRVHRGEYGRCLQCGEDIARKRLEVAPWAEYCVGCQQLQEQGLLPEIVTPEASDVPDEGAPPAKSGEAGQTDDRKDVEGEGEYAEEDDEGLEGTPDDEESD